MLVVLFSVLISIIYVVSLLYAMRQLDAKGCGGDYFIEWAIVFCPILNTVLACIYISKWIKANGIMTNNVKFKDLFK